MRRKFVVACVATLLILAAPALQSHADEWTLSLTNHTGKFENSDVYWTIVALNKSGQWCHLDAGGTLVPMSTADNTQIWQGDKSLQCFYNGATHDTFANYSLQLSQTSSILIDDDAFLNSGVMYISLGQNNWFPICVHDSGYAAPSVTNSALQGYDSYYERIEFSYNVKGGEKLFANTTDVDFFCFATAITLTDTSNHVQNVGFPASVTRDAVFGAFSGNQVWSKLIVGTSDIHNLRILSPEHVSAFSGLYTQYIDTCWKHYQAQPVTMHLQNNGTQTYTGQVLLDPNEANTYNFYWWKGTKVGTPSNAVVTIIKPTSQQLLSCVYPFKHDGDTTYNNIGKFMAAAMYRTVFLIPPTDPNESWCSAAMKAKYYTNKPVNFWSKQLHSMSIKTADSVNGLCYAFPYDDVCSQSPSVTSGDTKSLNIALQPWSSGH